MVLRLSDTFTLALQVIEIGGVIAMRAFQSLILIGVTALVTQVDAKAQLELRYGLDPAGAARTVKAEAKSRLAVIDPNFTVVDGGTNIGQTITPSTSLIGKTCVTNIGVTPAPVSTFRFGPGGTADSQSQTVVVRGDVINICR